MHYERFAVFNFEDRRVFPSEGRKKKSCEFIFIKCMLIIPVASEVPESLLNW